MEICKLKETKIKEQSEHALKYTNIPSNENLSLPTFEQFVNGDMEVRFLKNEKAYWLFLSDDDGSIVLNEFEDGFNIEKSDFKTLFCDIDQEEENYTKALDLCKKIWKGEGV